MGFTFISPTSSDFEIPSFVSSSLKKEPEENHFIPISIGFFPSENRGKISIYYPFCPLHELPDESSVLTNPRHHEHVEDDLYTKRIHRNVS
jgi:hypothetical protein